MSENREYDHCVRCLNRAAVGLFAVFVGFSLIGAAQAQINAAPPSVTSLGFGGRAINGTPPSVTSIGPRGPVFNPAFPSSRPTFGTGNHHHRPNVGVVPWGWGGYYAAPYGYYDQGDDTAEDPSADQYNGGPTIFDRRGSGPPSRPEQPNYAYRMPPADSASPSAAPASDPPAPDQPQTVLVFKDGHQLDVANYAIVGSTLYDLTPGRPHKIPLSALDLDETTKQNNDRGIDFQIPAGL